ncbi:MAG TPA: hypothetical protein VH855_30475 [Acetobacteraceae bacterium]|jgi:hypothetical protein
MADYPHAAGSLFRRRPGAVEWTPMEPIDDFMSVFVGICIGLAALSFLFS